MANPRKVALNALLRVEVDNGYSNIVLGNALKNAQMDKRDASLTSVLFYGVLERKITLDYIISQFSKTPVKKMSPLVLQALRLGIYQLLYTDKIPESAAVDQSVKLVKNSKDNRYSGFVNGVLRSVAREGESCLDFNRLKGFERVSVEYSVPVNLAQHLFDSYGQELATGFLNSCFGRPLLTVRANTTKTTAKDLAVKFNANYNEDSFIFLPSGMDFENSDEYKNGLFHVQDYASGLACKALNPKPNDRVLDLCSAPGGKSFTMAQMMENKGEISAFDLYDQKAELINSGAKRLGLSIIKTGVNNAEIENPELGNFDKILFDLPCSGIGIIRRKPEIRYKNVSFLDFFPDLQYRIIRNNVARLKKGGIAVFSTCTLNPKENQQTVKRILDTFDGLKPFPVLSEFQRVNGEADNFITLFPHIHNTDGFFVSAFVKK